MSLTEEDTSRLQSCLEGDGIAIVPTDTVYGLACNPQSKRGVKRLYDLKGRPQGKPSAIMFFSLKDALSVTPELGPRTRAALIKLLPGPVTVLLPNRSGGARGLRVPLYDGPLAALARVSRPALQSSANLSGGPDPRRLSDVPQSLQEGADLVLDGGELPGSASTVIDLTAYEQNGAWRTVREGPLDQAALELLLE